MTEVVNCPWCGTRFTPRTSLSVNTPAGEAGHSAGSCPVRGCDRVEDDPESDQGIARHDPARGPVGRALILAERGLEMRPRGHLSVT